MKKVIISILSILYVGLAQAAVSINLVKTTYDEDFNPTFEIEVKNTESIALTNIVVEFTFHENGANMYDIFSFKNIDKNIKVNVSPNGKETVKISLNGFDDYKYQSISLEKARFADGSIKTR